jgi:hypothetical protein
VSANDVYVDVGIETDPQDLLNDAYSYLEDQIAGWTPAQGNLDVWILMACSALAAESRDVASTIPASIFRWYGANLVGLPPIDATAATAMTTWTMVDNNGYTIPAGTQVSIDVPGSDPIAFITTADNTVPPGTTVLTNVQIEAVFPGAAASGIGTPGGVVTLLDALTFVQGVTQVAVTAGGNDAELDSDYLNRLTAELQLLAPRPILASDYAIFARNTVGVYRAAAIDGYNPIHNLLTLTDASLEASIGNWIALANCAVTQDATFGVDLTHSLKLTSSAAGDMTAIVAAAAQIPVLVGETYTFLATVKPASARTCAVGVNWYTSGSVLIGSTVYGAGVAVGAGATAALTATLVAPATAAFARIVVKVQATAAGAEVANFDKMSMRHGSSTDWVAGGTAETGQPRTVTVSALDINGAPVSSGIKTTLLAALQSEREVNFIVNALDAITNSIDVTVSVKQLANGDVPTTQAAILLALNAFLSPTTWGNTMTDASAPQDWANTTILRYLELATVINNAGGVAYIESLTFGLHGGSLSANDLTLIGQFPLVTAGTLTVTVDP